MLRQTAPVRRAAWVAACLNNLHITIEYIISPSRVCAVHEFPLGLNNQPLFANKTHAFYTLALNVCPLSFAYGSFHDLHGLCDTLA